MHDEEVCAPALPVEREDARGDGRVRAGKADFPERARALIAVIPLGDGAVGHGHRIAERNRLNSGRIERRQGGRYIGDGFQPVALHAEITGVGLKVEQTVEALVEEEPLGFVLGRGHGPDSFLRAGLWIDNNEVRMHDPGKGGESAVGAGQRVEIFVHGIHHPEAGEPAGGRIEAGEGAVGITADPDEAVGRLGYAGGKGGMVAVDGAEVLESAVGMRGIVAEKMAVGVRAEVEHTGARAPERGGGILLLARGGVELPAVAGGEIDIEDEKAAVVLAHGGEQRGLAIGAAARVEADPVDGLHRHAEVADDGFGGEERGEGGAEQAKDTQGNHMREGAKTGMGHSAFRAGTWTDFVISRQAPPDASGNVVFVFIQPAAGVR